MVTSLSFLTLYAALLGESPPPSRLVRSSAPADTARGDTETVRHVLARERFPWYDEKTERVKPVLPWFDPGAGRLGQIGETLHRWAKGISRPFRRLNRLKVPGVGRLGDILATGFALLLLTLILIVLVEMLRRYRWLDTDAEIRSWSTRTGLAHSVAGVPQGALLDADETWNLARRLRDQGDYAGAIVHLFAHQLLTLERLGHLRLVPGRTGRQLVRSVGDGRLRGWVEPTLGLFEAVYYGRRPPSAEAFEGAWSLAVAFQKGVSGEAAS
ncbi:MAG: hypothetical protein NVSMB9_32270 [Isosphaeraceae bacterium]